MISNHFLKHRIFRLFAISALVQGVFWLLVFPNFVAPQSHRLDRIEISQFELATLPDARAGSLGVVDYVQHEPVNMEFAVGHYATRSTFEINENPPDGLAIIPLGGGDNVRFYVNSRELPGKGSMSISEPDYYNLYPRVEQVPAHYLVTGTNTVEAIHVLGDPSRNTTFLPPVIGPYEEIREATAWGLFLRTELQVFAIAVGLVLCLFLIVVVLRAQSRELPFFLLVLTLSWSLQSLFFRWAEIPLHGQPRAVFYAVTFLLLSAAWPLFVNAWSEQPNRYFRNVLLAIFSGAAVFSVYLVYGVGGAEGWTRVEAMLDTIGLVFVTATVLRLVWHFATVRDEDRFWEAALFILFATLLAVYLVNLAFFDVSTSYHRLSQPLILLVFVVFFFSRNFELFRSSEQIQALLQDKLDVATAELDRAHARETRLARKQAQTDERDRLMRDMHDGLGSHLMSMFVMAKRGRGSHAQFAEGLQSVIDEMRLIINSLGTVGNTLEMVLENFRASVEPKVEASGLTLAFETGQLAGNDRDIDPRSGLQIYRILQEAVTNALKHSAGTRIEVSAGFENEGSALVLAVADNGAGIPEGQKTSSGRGLGNMEARARSIGAELEVGSTGDGTQVRLVVPLRARP